MSFYMFRYPQILLMFFYSWSIFQNIDMSFCEEVRFSQFSSTFGQHLSIFDQYLLVFMNIRYLSVFVDIYWAIYIHIHIYIFSIHNAHNHINDDHGNEVDNPHANTLVVWLIITIVTAVIMSQFCLVSFDLGQYFEGFV